MKNWVESGWYKYYFELKHWSNHSSSNKWLDGIWEANEYSAEHNSVEQFLNNLADYCDEQQLEIKSMIPLLKGKTYDYGQALENSTGTFTNAWAAGLSYGWGTTYTEGVMVLLQRVESIDEDEYQNRIKIRKLFNQKKEVQKKINKQIDKGNTETLGLTRAIKKLESRVQSKITVKSSFLGKDKYEYVDQEYKTEKEAFDAKSSDEALLLLKKQELDSKMTGSDEVKEKLKELEDKIKEIEMLIESIPSNYSIDLDEVN